MNIEKIYKQICPKCSKSRIVSRSMLSLIKHKRNSGDCRSCASKGNQSRLGSKHTDKTKLKMRLASLGKPKSASHKANMVKARTGIKLPKISGPKHYLWISDRTKLKKYYGSEERRSPAYKFWSKSVKDRDSWKCKICDCKKGLIAHHILGFTYYPELRYDINNGITLCPAHHPRKREDEAKLSPFFQGLVAEMK